MGQERLLPCQEGTLNARRVRLRDALLDELGSTHLGREVLPENGYRCELAAGLDSLQAGFASSLFWQPNDEGRAVKESTR